MEIYKVFNLYIMKNPFSELIEGIEQHRLWDSEETYSRNSYLKFGDELNTNIYFIVEGSVRVYVLEEEEELTIRLGYKNNIVAAIDSFVTEKKSDLYIQAIRKTEVKVLKKTTFLNWVSASTERLDLWRQNLEILVVQQMQRERDILTTSPIERYHRVLARSPQLFQEIPDKYIASYLRMSPETFSRIKKS